MTNGQRRLRRFWRNLRADLILIGMTAAMLYVMALALHGMGSP